MLVVFEGLDKTGKTTQSQLLYKYLTENGKPAMLIRFPDRNTEVGELIDKFLKCKVKLSPATVHLLFAANRMEKVDIIQTALENGTTVICDRYYYSGIAYGCARGLDPQWCAAVDAKMPQPDKVLFFPEIVCDVTGEEVYETKEFQAKVLEQFFLIDKTVGKWLIVKKNTPENVKEEIIAFCS